MKPFDNETETKTIGNNLHIENRTDHIIIYGDTNITLDKQGLKTALELKKLIDDIIVTLSNQKLPEKIEIKPITTIKNPFI